MKPLIPFAANPMRLHQRAARASLLALGLLAAGVCSRAQVIYSPSLQFFNNASGPLLFNTFGVAALNGSGGPSSEVKSATPNSGAPSYTGSLAAAGPLGYSLSVANSATFGSFLGPVTATESASMSTSADYGHLSASGTATATGSFSDAYFGNITVTTAGQPVVQYTDKITITPTLAHAAGTFVPVSFTEAFASSHFSYSGVSQENYAELLGLLSVSETSGPVVQVNDIIGESYEGPRAGGAAAPGLFLPLPSPLLPSETYGGLVSITSTVNLEVGLAYVFTGGLFAGGEASATFDTSEGLTDDANVVSIGADAYTLIDTGGLNYTTASGTAYATSLPSNSAPGVPERGTTASMLALVLTALERGRRKLTGMHAG